MIRYEVRFSDFMYEYSEKIRQHRPYAPSPSTFQINLTAMSCVIFSFSTSIMYVNLRVVQIELVTTTQSMYRQHEL